MRPKLIRKKGLKLIGLGNGSWKKYNYVLAHRPSELKHIGERKASRNRRSSGRQPFQKLLHLATLSTIFPWLWGRAHGGRPQAVEVNKGKGVRVNKVETGHGINIVMRGPTHLLSDTPTGLGGMREA